MKTVELVPTGHGNPIRKLVPSAKLPVAGTLRSFSATDVERLEHALVEPLECVYDASFRLRAAEEEHTRPLAAIEAVARDVGGYEARGGRSRRRRMLPRGLSRAEEQALFLRYNYARYRLMRVLRAYRGKRLTGRAAHEVLRWEGLARESRDRIVQHNLGLVPTMIERSRITGVDFGELISEGQFALLRAASKFDASRGFKFSTYACRAILSSISRSVALTVRHRNHFPTEFDPDLQKSDELERRREAVAGDFVSELNEILAANLAELTSAEKRVLFERFGVSGKRPRMGVQVAQTKTLRQVAEMFGVTKERVRQIQNKALHKLRDALQQRVFAA
jgi:RNA polymerase sigma factor (sigma-70 family)